VFKQQSHFAVFEFYGIIKIEDKAMRVELNNTAKKENNRLNEPYRSRIAYALDKLEKEPPEGDIKKLQGRDGYRVVVGAYRILFDIEDDRIDVFKIAPRGDIYKEN
jgi:mRNA interferase RelE/StbE